MFEYVLWHFGTNRFSFDHLWSDTDRRSWRFWREFRLNPLWFVRIWWLSFSFLLFFLHRKRFYKKNEKQIFQDSTFLCFFFLCFFVLLSSLGPISWLDILSKNFSMIKFKFSKFSNLASPAPFLHGVFSHHQNHR